MLGYLTRVPKHATNILNSFLPRLVGLSSHLFFLSPMFIGQSCLDHLRFGSNLQPGSCDPYRVLRNENVVCEEVSVEKLSGPQGSFRRFHRAFHEAPPPVLKPCRNPKQVSFSIVYRRSSELLIQKRPCSLAPIVIATDVEIAALREVHQWPEILSQPEKEDHRSYTPQIEWDFMGEWKLKTNGRQARICRYYGNELAQSSPDEGIHTPARIYIGLGYCQDQAGEFAQHLPFVALCEMSEGGGYFEVFPLMGDINAGGSSVRNVNHLWDIIYEWQGLVMNLPIQEQDVDAALVAAVVVPTVRLSVETNQVWIPTLSVSCCLQAEKIDAISDFSW